MATDAAAPANEEFVRGIGPIQALSLVVGTMIGSGIFIVSASMARDLKSSGLLLLAWAVTAVMTVIGALSYGELAAAIPTAGGQYVFLREAFGPMFGFLYGWTVFLVVQTGTIGAVAVAFAKFLGFFVPAISAASILVPLPFGFDITTQRVAAIFVIILLTGVNCRGLREGATV